MEFNIILPVPPSVNALWRFGKGNWYSTTVHKNYTNMVHVRVIDAKQPKFSSTDRLKMTINYYPTDRRRRDIDNICKVLCDSLQHAGVYPDDSQIDQLSIVRHINARLDYISVTINAIID